LSDYKRFVSYIYEYEQGEKRENTGFVKVDARGETCKIWVHMKGFYSHGQSPYQMYVFCEKRERLEGFLMGELRYLNGALEWNGVTKRDSLMESGVGLEDSRGLYIEGEGRVFAAEWDDCPVSVERFEIGKMSARQQAEPMEAEAETEEKPKVENEKEEMQIQAEEKEFVEAAELSDPRQKQWSYLTGRFPVRQYQDGDAKVSGIRLEKRDLSRIPREKWEIGNNSFLLHGFYHYQHLLLLRRQSADMIQYLVGVPGIYNEREQMMASMFGFEEFKVINGPDGRNGSFGYWCRLLQ